MNTAPDAAREADLRRNAFTTTTVAFLIFLYLFSPFTLTFLGWFVDYEDNISHKIHEVAFGVLFAMIFVGVLLQLRDPIRYRIGLLQAIIGAVTLSIVISTTTGWEWPTLLYLLPLGLLIWLHPQRRELFRFRLRPRRSLVVLMLLITGPLLTEFFNEYGKAVNEVFFHQQHWGGMATYALVILILGYLAAFRVDGWRILAATASIGVGLFGLLSLIYDFDASAAPALPAVLAIIWAVVFSVFARRVDLEAPRSVVEPPARSGGARLFAPVRVGAGAFGILVLGWIGNGFATEFTSPNVPHLITSSSSSYCRSCHLTGKENAPVIDLDFHGDGTGLVMVCRNCHDLPPISPATAVVDAGTGGEALRNGAWNRTEVGGIEQHRLGKVLAELAAGRAP